MSDDVVVFDRLECDEWQGTATLDGHDVSHRCSAVLMRNERPYGLELFEVHPDGQPVVLGEGGDRYIETRIHYGEITVQIRPRHRTLWPDE